LTFSINIFSDLQQIFYWQFMQNAYEAGTVIAIVAGIVGYFVVIRKSSFAAHALSHIGFAGGAGAALFGISPVLGLLAFTTLGGTSIAVLSPKASRRDVSIGAVLAFMLGIGLLFADLYTYYSGGNSIFVYSILFGEILAISSHWSPPYGDVQLTLVAGIALLVALAVVYRPLLFASLDEEVAEAKGLPTFGLGIVFMLLVAIATSIAVQVVGVLLIFSLLVTPAAIAQQLAKQPQLAMLISIAIAVVATWVGLFIAFFTIYPVSFFITTIVFVIYLLVRFTNWLLKSRRLYHVKSPSMASI
jgi:zinc/manganese transport system permease protein